VGESIKKGTGPLSDTYAIGELARAFGITARTIRFYEDKGLVAPRRDGAARIYSEGDRRRLALIVRGRRVGLSLAEIKETLELCEVDTALVSEARRAATSLRGRIGALQAQRREIELVIEDLMTATSEIERQLATPGGEARSAYDSHDDSAPADASLHARDPAQ
jgi:DNA-binding transcriptional MerR regulator